jgi:CubicO group peptidase (beta-lactamase class C family)
MRVCQEEMFFGDGHGGFRSGWRFGVGADIKRVDLSSAPGRFGWVGGTGTTSYSDPGEKLAGSLLSQCIWNPHAAADHGELLDTRLPGDRGISARDNPAITRNGRRTASVSVVSVGSPAVFSVEPPP